MRSERRQPEGVATVLDPEHTQEEGVHAEKDSSPDENSDLLLARVGDTRNLECQADGGKGEDSICGFQLVTVERWIKSKLTHCGNDLSLKTELVLEATSEVADTTLAVGLNIGDLADVIEHVSAGEEQNGDQADGGPEVAVLNDRQKVRCGDCKEGEDTDDSGRYGDDLHVVDWTLDGWVRRVGEMAAEPCVDGFGLVGTGGVGLELYYTDMQILTTHPERKSNRVGAGSVFALGPVVGWKRSRTGAVWSCICYYLSALI